MEQGRKGGHGSGKNKKILGSYAKRVKKQLRAKSRAKDTEDTEKDREVEKSIKADKKRWMKNITLKQEK